MSFLNSYCQALANVAACVGPRRGSLPLATAGRFRPRLEALEDRFVLAAGVLAAGALDPAFGDGGVVKFSFGVTDDVWDVAVQPDGKVLVAGSTQITGNDMDFALARFNPDGTLDTAFGELGRVRTDFTPNQRDQARALTVQPDGKILVAGLIREVEWALARYNADGTLDTAFGAGGYVATDFLPGQEDPFAIALAPDGKIVVGGGANPSPFSSKSVFAVARYHPDGTLDTSFSEDGKVTADLGNTEAGALAVMVQPDGKVIAAGPSAASSTSNRSFALVRYNADGTPDATFGATGTGVVREVFPEGSLPAASAAALQPDGKIVVSGILLVGGSADFGLMRFNADGTLDPTFGGDGKVTSDFGSDEDARGLALQPDGKVVVVGLRTQPGGAKSLVARYNSDGSLDAGFGDGGHVLTDLAPDNDYFQKVAVGPDGKVVAAGVAGGGTDRDFGVARYLASGNVGPVAVADGPYTTDEDSTLSVAAPGVLGNDADENGDALTAVLVDGPGHGALTLNADGSFTYTPDANYNGPDGFTYRASDGQAESAPVSVALTVVPANDAPTGADDDATVGASTTTTIAVLANDADPDGDALQVVSVTQPASGRGVVSINGDGTLSYTQVIYATGSETIEYTVSDGHGGTATATVTVSLAIPASAGIDMLKAQVPGLGLNAGQANSLVVKLDAAADSLGGGDSTAAGNQLDAFLDQIRALVLSGELDEVTADLFESQLEALQEAL